MSEDKFERIGVGSPRTPPEPRPPSFARGGASLNVRRGHRLQPIASNPPKDTYRGVEEDESNEDRSDSRLSEKELEGDEVDVEHVGTDEEIDLVLEKYDFPKDGFRPLKLRIAVKILRLKSEKLQSEYEGQFKTLMRLQKDMGTRLEAYKRNLLELEERVVEELKKEVDTEKKIREYRNEIATKAMRTVGRTWKALKVTLILQFLFVVGLAAVPDLQENTTNQTLSSAGSSFSGAFYVIFYGPSFIFSLLLGLFSTAMRKKWIVICELAFACALLAYHVVLEVLILASYGPSSSLITTKLKITYALYFVENAFTLSIIVCLSILVHDWSNAYETPKIPTKEEMVTPKSSKKSSPTSSEPKASHEEELAKIEKKKKKRRELSL